MSNFPHGQARPAFEPEQLGIVEVNEVCQKIVLTAPSRSTVSIPDGTYDFVTAHDGRLYAGRGHESICRRWPVTPIRYAGTIEVLRGVLVAWTNQSGHYPHKASDAQQAGLPVWLFRPFDGSVRGRELGYYWVRLGQYGPDEVARWDGQRWYRCGASDDVDDRDVRVHHRVYIDDVPSPTGPHGGDYHATWYENRRPTGMPVHPYRTAYPVTEANPVGASGAVGPVVAHRVPLNGTSLRTPFSLANCGLQSVTMAPIEADWGLQSVTMAPIDLSTSPRVSVSATGPGCGDPGPAGYTGPTTGQTDKIKMDPGHYWVRFGQHGDVELARHDGTDWFRFEQTATYGAVTILAGPMSRPTDHQLREPGPYVIRHPEHGPLEVAEWDGTTWWRSGVDERTDQTVRVSLQDPIVVSRYQPLRDEGHYWVRIKGRARNQPVIAYYGGSTFLTGAQYGSPTSMHGHLRVSAPASWSYYDDDIEEEDVEVLSDRLVPPEVSDE